MKTQSDTNAGSGCQARLVLRLKSEAVRQRMKKKCAEPLPEHVVDQTLRELTTEYDEDNVAYETARKFRIGAIKDFRPITSQNRQRTGAKHPVTHYVRNHTKP